ncbi:MAG: hypothetical protein GSR77_00200 [Desulfurococcales archaeon]|nr:hypothetical protein [Desulfurococcales archaeon]
MFEFKEDRTTKDRTKQKNENQSVNISLSSKVVALYPGESAILTLTVSSNNTEMVRLEPRYPPETVEIEISPQIGYTPIKARLKILAVPGAQPGIYPASILVIDTKRNLASREKLTVIIMDKVVDKSIIKHLPAMLRITKELGMQGLFWYIATHVYPEGATFSQLHALHKLITRRRASPGTTGNILAYMVKKKILVRENGVYKALVHDIETLRSRIDSSRIRLGQRRQDASPKQDHRSGVPIQVYWAFDRARRIMKKHGPLAAMYFLEYTLVGVRQTGFLLLWINDWFVYCESKTGFCHHFTSQLLSRYFRMLGLQEGIMYSQTNNHEEARRKAQKYIKEYYRSFRAARRLHYMIKEWNLIGYENHEVYTLELLYYQDGSIGVRIWDEQKRELLEELGVKNEEPTKVEHRTAFPEEHIYQPNEETYFHRIF